MLPGKSGYWETTSHWRFKILESNLYENQVLPPNNFFILGEYIFNLL